LPLDYDRLRRPRGKIPCSGCPISTLRNRHLGHFEQ
jgi:hypothetical protein